MRLWLQAHTACRQHCQAKVADIVSILLVYLRFPDALSVCQVGIRHLYCFVVVVPSLGPTFLAFKAASSLSYKHKVLQPILALQWCCQVTPSTKVSK